MAQSRYPSSDRKMIDFFLSSNIMDNENSK